MANSQRYIILEYLANTLFATITTGNGYNFTVMTKERGLKSVNELTDDQFPALFVASADEKRKNATNKDFNSLMSVSVWGAVKESSSTLKIQAQLDNLIEDVTKAIYTDPTQGGRVAFSDISEVITDEGDQHPHAFFRMTLEFQYKSVGIQP